MPASKREEDLLKRAKFVFKGTVQKLKASNVAEIDKKETAKTVVVMVDEILQAPDVLDDYAGQEITVKLSEGEKVKKGQRAVFYANAWIFGENVAVESIGHRDIEGPALALSASFRDPAKNLATEQVKERLETADVIVTGKVTNIRLPEEEKKPTRARAVRAGAAGAAPARRRPISEHDPKWREAVIQVADVEKGSHNKKEIVIRFPDSNDVRWYRAPKFHPGQEGVFILHKTRKSAPKKTRRVGATLTNEEAETTEAYTALHPADFQPLRQHPEIRTLIRGTPASSVEPSGAEEEDSEPDDQ